MLIVLLSSAAGHSTILKTGKIRVISLNISLPEMFPHLPLPQEILLTVLQLLPFRDLLKARRLSRQAHIWIRQNADYLRHRRSSKITLRGLQFGLGLEIAIPFFRPLLISFTDFEISNFDLSILQHFRCSEINSNLPCDALTKFASLLPNGTRKLKLINQAELQVKPLLESLKYFPELEFLSVDLSVSRIDRQFFTNERVRRLRGLRISSPDSHFNFYNPRKCLDDSILKVAEWQEFSLKLPNKITIDGLNEVLRQWSSGKREIIEFRLNIDYSREILLAGFTVRDGLSTTLTRSVDSTTLTLKTDLGNGSWRVRIIRNKTF